MSPIRKIEDVIAHPSERKEAVREAKEIADKKAIKAVREAFGKRNNK